MLLDTHTFVWFNLNDLRLTGMARHMIEESSNRVLISPASYWKIAIKIGKRKFALAGPYDVFWRSGIDDNGFAILPIELRHTTQLLSMPHHHSDPFDRLLVAQALADDIPLVSSDTTLDKYGVTRTG